MNRAAYIGVMERQECPLHETWVSADGTAVYAGANDVHEYAEAIVALQDDEPWHSKMGRLGYDPVEQELAWRHQQDAYLGVYRQLTAGGTPGRTGE